MQESHVCYSNGNFWFCESLNDSLELLVLDSSSDFWDHKSLWRIYLKYQFICIWLGLHRLHCFWVTKKELLTSAVCLFQKNSFFFFLNTQSYTYHSYILSVNALIQLQLCGGFKAVFCQQKHAHVIPRADPLQSADTSFRLQARPLVVSILPLTDPASVRLISAERLPQLNLWWRTCYFSK